MAALTKLLCATTLATTVNAGGLVGPDTLVPYGSNRRGRQQSYGYVRDAAKGFFVGGSSLQEMNGVYERKKDGLPSRAGHGGIWYKDGVLAYQNSVSGWWMAMIDASPPEENSKKKKGEDGQERKEASATEWLLMDDTYHDRFHHDGDTILPGTGTSWSHIKTDEELDKNSAQVAGDAGDGGEDEEDDGVLDGLYEQLYGSKRPQKGKGKKGGAGGKKGRFGKKGGARYSTYDPSTDDLDELPWQIVGIMDPEMMHKLKMWRRYYDYNVDNAIAGKDLPQLPYDAESDHRGETAIGVDYSEPPEPVRLTKIVRELKSKCEGGEGADDDSGDDNADDSTEDDSGNEGDNEAEVDADGEIIDSHGEPSKLIKHRKAHRKAATRAKKCAIVQVKKAASFESADLKDQDAPVDPTDFQDDGGVEKKEDPYKKYHLTKEQIIETYGLNAHMENERFSQILFLVESAGVQASEKAFKDACITLDGALSLFEDGRGLFQPVQNVAAIEEAARHNNPNGQLDQRHFNKVKLNAAHLAGHLERWLKAQIWKRQATYYRHGYSNDAATHPLNMALREFPRYKDAMLEKGLLFLDSSEPGKAKATFETLLKIDRKYRSPHNQISGGFVGENLVGGAAEQFVDRSELEKEILAKEAKERGEDAEDANDPNNRFDSMAGDEDFAYRRRQKGGSKWGGRYGQHTDKVTKAAEKSKDAEVKAREEHIGRGKNMGPGLYRFLLIAMGHFNRKKQAQDDYFDLNEKKFGGLLEAANTREDYDTSLNSVGGSGSGNDADSPGSDDGNSSGKGDKFGKTIDIDVTLKERSNFYTLLQVPIDFTEVDVLKKAYRKMSKLAHPDRHKGSDRLFSLVAKAHETLLNSKLRQMYDEARDLDSTETQHEEEDAARPMREEVERHYFPEHFGFNPFGDAFERKRSELGYGGVMK